jgi:hypothetical protein
MRLSHELKAPGMEVFQTFSRESAGKSRKEFSSTE